MNDDPDKRGTPRAVTNPPAKKAMLYDRARHAAELRRSGCTWDEVAAGAGYSHKANAQQAVKNLMIEARDLAYGEADLYRMESLDRLMELYKAARPIALAGSDKHLTVCARIIKQMGELRGENMPVQIEIGMGDVDQLLAAAEQELGRRVAAAQVEASRVQAGADPDRRG
jgi:hypothetical protein